MVSAKSPLTVMLAMVAGRMERLVTATFCGLLVVRIGWPTKDKIGGSRTRASEIRATKASSVPPPKVGWKIDVPGGLAVGKLSLNDAVRPAT